MKYYPYQTERFIPATHEDMRKPGILKYLIKSAGVDEFNSLQMVQWAKLLPREITTKHSHASMQELYFLTDGVVRVRVGDREFEMNRGDVLVVEAGEPHVLINTLDSPAFFVVLGLTRQ